MFYQVTLNFDHESGEGTQSFTHDRVTRIVLADDDMLYLWQGDRMIDINLYCCNWYHVQVFHPHQIKR